MLHVSVSLDGADAATHEWVRGVSGSFDAAINGIENLVKAGIRPQIIMSLIRRNMGHIDSVVKLAQFVGASSVKFNPVQPTARGDQMHNAMETLSVTELVELGNLVVKELSPSSTIPLCFTQPLAFHPLGRILSDEGCGYGVCRITDILGVLADGSYSLCGIGESVPDLVFGHSSEKSLNDVWLNSKVLIELREGLPDKLEGICGECLLKATCNGSCIAQNYYRSRHLWAPFWFCEEAHRLNVFPTSRKMHISNII
jgi:SynChlorMet cassette radical SAM/SPASM protein ScmF